MNLKKKLYHTIGKKTPEEKIRERIKIIQQLVKEREQSTEETTTQEMKRKFYLDALAVANKDGEILEREGEEDFQEILKNQHIYNYITESPETEMLTIRNNGSNQVLYNHGNRLYLMKTPGTISKPEIKRIIHQMNEN